MRAAIYCTKHHPGSLAAWSQQGNTQWCECREGQRNKVSCELYLNTSLSTYSFSTAMPTNDFVLFVIPEVTVYSLKNY